MSFNTRDLLRQCLRSVLAQALPPERAEPLEVIVVDNGSADGSPAMVRAEFGDAVTLLESRRNLGFAAANNLGIRRARGRYLVLLNSDTVVQPGALAVLYRFMARHADVGLAGPRLLNPDGSRQPACFRFPSLPMLWLDLFPLHPRLPFQNLFASPLNGRYRAERGDRPFAVDHPLGACMIVRREAIVAVGLLDDGYFMYCEEVDWCFRLRAAGWRIYFVPQARVVHYGGQSARQLADEMFVQLHRSRLRLLRRHYSPARRAAAESIIRLGLGWRIVRAWLDDKLRRGPADTAALRRRQYRRIFE